MEPGVSAVLVDGREVPGDVTRSDWGTFPAFKPGHAPEQINALALLAMAARLTRIKRAYGSAVARFKCEVAERTKVE